MGKTIQEQIAEMETRCSQLEELQKLFEKAVKNEFGIEGTKWLTPHLPSVEINQVLCYNPRYASTKRN